MGIGNRQPGRNGLVVELAQLQALTLLRHA